MTDETPRVNHSFASPAYVIFRQAKPHIAQLSAKPRVAGWQGLIEELPRPPDER